MATKEGVRRIATSFRVLGWIWAAIAFFLATSIYVEELGIIGFIFSYIILGIVPLGVAYGLAWILDGFSKPSG